jgi:hypothetical protein
MIIGEDKARPARSFLPAAGFDPEQVHRSLVINPRAAHPLAPRLRSAHEHRHPSERNPEAGEELRCRASMRRHRLKENTMRSPQLDTAHARSAAVVMMGHRRKRRTIATTGPRTSRRQLLRATLGVVAAATGGWALRGTRVSAAPVHRISSMRSSPGSGRASETAGTVVVQWNGAALEAIRRTRPGPPMVARALAVVHTCIYDAWAVYDPVALTTRTAGFLRRPVAEQTLANKTAALSYAAHRALSDLFPSEAPLFDGVMDRLGYDPAGASADPTSPSGMGIRCAQAVLEFRHGDGANQLGDLQPGAYADYTDYTPVNDLDHVVDPNRWQPLRFSDGQGGFVAPKYIAPHWGLVTPFAMASGSQFRPAAGPELYPSDGYRRQAGQVLGYSAGLTDEQKVVTEYWADGPSSELPPGHWCLFGAFVSQRDQHGLDADVQLFFALTNALMDAGIAAWDAKRAFDSVRPITAIRFLFAGQQVRAWGGPYQGTRLILGEDWKPYQADTFITPPFPEYVSGHSTFSAAGAEVLKRFTGSDAFGASVTRPAGSSLFEPGAVPATDVTLSWATFSAAADEAGLSRRYGGIHFEAGDLAGRAMGRRIGAQAWDKAQAYITGTA